MESAEQLLRPRVLLVEDEPLDAQLAQIMLDRAGFLVTHATSILEAERSAEALLTSSEGGSAPLILLDIRMPDPSHPELVSPLLVATLTARMQRGELRPAAMIAITSHISSEIEEEALFAGCLHVLAKPLNKHQSLWLRSLVDQPVNLAAADQGRRLYQQKAEEILGLVRRASISNTWTTADAQLLLSSITPFPPPSTIDPARQAALLLRCGGDTILKQQLSRCAVQLPDPHGKILQAFLDGTKQRQMPALFPEYDRSTIYRYIQSLPKKISDWLAIHS